MSIGFVTDFVSLTIETGENPKNLRKVTRFAAKARVSFVILRLQFRLKRENCARCYEIFETN